MSTTQAPHPYGRGRDNSKNPQIPRLEEDRFTLVAADEAFFVQNASQIRVGKTGTRSVAAYYGNHASVYVFG